MRAALVSAALVAVACDGDTVMTIEGYDRSCAYDSDCVLVYLGDVCGCSCEAAAINVGMADEWQRERDRLEARCGAVPDCAPCPDVDVVCNSWFCEAR